MSSSQKIWFCNISMPFPYPKAPIHSFPTARFVLSLVLEGDEPLIPISKSMTISVNAFLRSPRLTP